MGHNKEASKRYRLKHKAERAAKDREWRKSVPGRIWLKNYYDWRRSLGKGKYVKGEHLKRTYGMSIQEWDTLFNAQNGKCAICFKSPESNKDLCVDHNHITKKVRGLLCRNCNSMIGYSKESVLILEEGIRYLKER